MILNNKSLNKKEILEQIEEYIHIIQIKERLIDELKTEIEQLKIENEELKNHNSGRQNHIPVMKYSCFFE